jgi:hypothetical protein
MPGTLSKNRAGGTIFAEVTNERGEGDARACFRGLGAEMARNRFAASNTALAPDRRST